MKLKTIALACSLALPLSAMAANVLIYDYQVDENIGSLAYSGLLSEQSVRRYR